MPSSLLFKKNGREKIGFVGVGRSTLGVYRYLKEKGYGNFVFRAEKPTVLPSFVDAKTVFGEGYLSDIKEDVLFLSPSVRSDKKELIRAKARGTILSSDCDLFFRENRGEVFAVTGSDGKSTTVTMLCELLKRGGGEVRLGGNIGMALCPYLSENTQEARFVCELSSFQLLDMMPNSKRAVITTVSPNHLDYHKSFDEYLEAKRHIYVHTEQPVLNGDCPLCKNLLGRRPFAVYSLTKSEKELAAFGAEVSIYRKDDGIFLDGEKIFSLHDMKVPGLYNVQNLMCATAMSYGTCEFSFVSEFAKSFHGIPHRAETVAEVGGVTYVDSSIDSSPARTIATLGAFPFKPLVILGGKGKGVAFDDLILPLSQHAKGVILMGETGMEISRLLQNSEAFRGCGAFLLRAESMRDAVKLAAENAKPGDTVLLSPASTSFDLYRNFEDRGEDFKEEVRKLDKG